MKKKTKSKPQRVIGPLHILLPDSIVDRGIDIMRDAVIKAGRAGKPRGIFAQITVTFDCDRNPHMFLTCCCPTHEQGARFVKAVKRIGIFQKATP